MDFMNYLDLCETAIFQTPQKPCFALLNFDIFVTPIHFDPVFIKIDRRNCGGSYSITEAANQNLSLKVKDFEEEASLAGN